METTKKSRKSRTTRPTPKFTHGDIVTFSFQNQEVDGIVMAFDGEVYCVRLFGDYYQLSHGLVQVVEDELRHAYVDPKNPIPARRFFTRMAAQRLMGRTIRNVRYLTAGECMDLEWNDTGLVMELDNGTYLMLLADDDGSGPGALEGRVPADGVDGTEEDTLFSVPACEL